MNCRVIDKKCNQCGVIGKAADFRDHNCNNALHDKISQLEARVAELEAELS